VGQTFLPLLFSRFLFFVSVSPSEKSVGGFQQAGKKKKGRGENEFLPACSAALRAAVGREAARPCVSKEAKPAKIVSLFEKNFCGPPLKMFQFLRALSAVRRRAAGRDCRPKGGN